MRGVDVRQARRARPLPEELTGGIVRRAFHGDPDVYRRFIEMLRAPLGDTDIVLRGSAVTGESYRGHDAFDDTGPGTSDLDLVLVGRDAFRLWDARAFYLPRVNTKPLTDHTPWVAPALEPARQAAQELVRRPVSIQAMARWFLELRRVMQGQPHVTLWDP